MQGSNGERLICLSWTSEMGLGSKFSSSLFPVSHYSHAALGLSSSPAVCPRGAPHFPSEDRSLEMPCYGAASVSRRFGSKPSPRAPPELWFRCNLGNIVKVIPSASIPSLPPFYTPTLKFGTVSLWSHVVKHITSDVKCLGGGQLHATHPESQGSPFLLIYRTLQFRGFRN